VQSPLDLRGGEPEEDSKDSGGVASEGPEDDSVVKTSHSRSSVILTIALKSKDCKERLGGSDH
jgi:hypothetical protein